MNGLNKLALPTVAVVIASVGRAEELHATVLSILAQDPTPEEIVISVPGREHVLDATLDLPAVRLTISPKGATAQRNTGFEAVESGAAIISFLDDDLELVAGYFRAVAHLFAAHDDIAIVTGAVIADGVKTGGVPREEARAIAREDAAQRAASPPERQPSGAYGCMNVRRDIAERVRFDLRLPLYSWLDDLDYAHFCGQFGEVVKCPQARMVHLGVSAGRTSGKRYGYSQIMNSWYLHRKGSLPGLGRVVATYWARPFLMNLARSVTGDRLIDRRGRLRGNILAFADILRGRVTPERIIDFDD